MNFNYNCECSMPPMKTVYHFHYALDESDITRILWKYGDTPGRFSLNFSTLSPPQQSSLAFACIRDSIADDNVDLGINYKKKYEELAELLNPYKLEDDMEPSTTLKMILKYCK